MDIRREHYKKISLSNSMRVFGWLIDIIGIVEFLRAWIDKAGKRLFPPITTPGQAILYEILILFGLAMAASTVFDYLKRKRAKPWIKILTPLIIQAAFAHILLYPWYQEFIREITDIITISANQIGLITWAITVFFSLFFGYMVEELWNAPPNPQYYNDLL